MELKILGPLEVVDGDRPVPISGQKARALLALLIVRRGDVVTVDEIIDALWPDGPPKTAEHSVQVHVSELRKALGNVAEIVTRPNGYALRVPAGALDVDRSETLAERARAAASAGDPQQAAALFRAALDVWRGAPLPEFAYDEFARREIDRLDERRLTTLEDRIDAELAVGRHTELVAELRSHVDANPYRERLRAALMLALYRSGRQTDALQEFHRARTLVADELGIDPGPALVELNAAILAQDPELEFRSDALEPGAGAVEPPRERRPTVGPARKIVSILFAEVAADGTNVVDPEASGAVGRRAIDAGRAVLEAYGSTISSREDGLIAAFGHPVAHEDDALRAVRAAVELGSRLSELNGDLEMEGLPTLAVRIGVHTGEVLTDIDGAVDGLDAGAIRRARAIAAQATGDDPVIDDITYDLVRAAVDHEPMPEDLHRVTGVRAGVRGVARRIDSPIVGRDDELAALERAFERTRTERRCELLTVHGDAGIGKTRLVDEFIKRVEVGSTVLEGRCLAYGEGITYWPIAEAVRGVASIAEVDDEATTRSKLLSLLADEGERDRVADAIAQLLGFAGTVPAPGELLWAIRRLLESMTAESAVVLSIEDVHWAEPTLLDLIEGVADWLRDSPLLLLCTARPDIFERRPGWGGGRSNASMIGLQPLSSNDTALLIENLVQHPGLDADAQARITEAAEGNPLFVEQLLSMLIDEGLLTRSDGAWTLAADLSAIAMPTSLQTLLTARLDALTSQERDVLGIASVIGRTFDVETVEAIGTGLGADDIAATIVQLVRKDLVRPARTSGGERFRFRHVLIMNATYETLPKRARAAMHERAADRVRDASGEQSAAYDEIVGDHLARAAGYLEQLGPSDDHLAGLRHRAGSHLAAAGRRAFARGDMPAVVTLHGRAASLLPEDDPDRLRILPELGQALVEVGRSAEADSAFDEAVAVGLQRGDLHTAADALLFRFESELWRGLFDRAGDSSALARELIEDHPEDGFVQQRCWSILGIWAPTWAEQYESTQRALEFGEQIGDAKGRNENIQMMSGLLATGPGSADEGLAITDDFLARAVGDPVTEAAIVVNARAQLLGMTGQMDQARAEYERARRTFRDLGLPLWLGASGTIGPAATEDSYGDPAIAESLTREGIEILDRLGDAQSWLIQVMVIHGHSLASQGRVEDATAMLPRIAALEHPFDQAHVTWLRGHIALAAGRSDEAVRELGAALDEIHEDWVLAHEHLLLMLADALRAAGDLTASRARAEEALSLCERKGDTVFAVRARALL